VKAPVPHNEAERLSALVGLDILDTEPEEVFDRIIRLAAVIVDVPIVLVSLIDRDRQWFKAKVGLEATETHRDLAFCSHAVLEDEILLVPDALQDPRFADNPLVTGAPDIRFYAGAPLILRDGIRLGTLCAIDRKPRNLTDQQSEALRDLAAVVVDELALRQSLKEVAEISDLQRQSMLELRRTNQALQQFAHMASHDLRAPLKNMINLADIAVLDTEGEVLDLVQPIRDSAVRLEEVVRGCGRLAGLEQGHTEDRLVSDLVDQARNAADSDMVIDLRQDMNLTCDPVLVTQVLVNLLDNVEKYGSEREVVIDARDESDSVVISVSNAVEETFDVDPSIFAPFRRLVADGSGQGLGLAIVERVAHLHGGSVSASCSDNTFTVEICLAKQAIP
jgi:signal transduction histidine kinase